LPYSGTANAAAGYTDVMNGTYVKNILFALLLIVAFAGAYALYRYIDAAALTSEYVLATFDPAGYKPAVCEGVQGGFGGGAFGRAYIYEGMERADYIYAESNVQYSVHYIVDRAGIRYQWNDGSSAGGRAPDSSVVWQSRDVTFFSLTCSPWWFPDASIFTLPDDVTFQDVTS